MSHITVVATNFVCIAGLLFAAYLLLKVSLDTGLSILRK